MAHKKGTKLSASVARDVPVETTRAQAQEQKRWRAEDDLRTMQRAKEIESDKERVKMMKTVAKEQMKNLKKVCK